jgi:hypothetical protein
VRYVAIGRLGDLRTTICRCPNSVTAFSRVFSVGGTNFSGTEVGWAYSSKNNGKFSLQYAWYFVAKILLTYFEKKFF